MLRPFEGLIGNSGELKLLQFLLPLKDMEFNISELALEADVSRPVTDRVVKKFVKYGIMKEAGRRGRATYYQLNEESSFVSVFENFNNLIIEQMLGEDLLYQIGDYWKSHVPIAPLRLAIPNVIKPCVVSPLYDEQEQWASKFPIGSRERENLPVFEATVAALPISPETGFGVTLWGACNAA